jgi:hypothetical protein
VTASSRTSKLYSALSAKERALLVLRAWKEGREEDDETRRTMPDSQVSEFNRYIELMNAVNNYLGRWLVVLRAYVEQLGLVSLLLTIATMWGDDVLTLSDSLPTKIKEKSYIKNVIDRAPFTGGEGEQEPPLRPAFDALLLRLERQIPEYWRELRCAEILLDQAASEFGEDAALPEVREIVVWLLQELIGLRDKLKQRRLREPTFTEPEEEDQERVRRIAHWPGS